MRWHSCHRLSQSLTVNHKARRGLRPKPQRGEGLLPRCDVTLSPRAMRAGQPVLCGGVQEGGGSRFLLRLSPRDDLSCWRVQVQPRRGRIRYKRLTERSAGTMASPFQVRKN